MKPFNAMVMKGARRSWRTLAILGIVYVDQKRVYPLNSVRILLCAMTAHLPLYKGEVQEG